MTPPDETRDDPQELPPAAGPPPWSIESTVIYGVLWLSVMLFGWSGHLVENPIDQLSYPEWSAARLVGRDLALAEAASARDSQAENLVLPITARPPSVEDAWESAVAIHFELIDALESADESSHRLRHEARLAAQASALSGGAEPLPGDSLREPFAIGTPAPYPVYGDLARTHLAVMLAEDGDLELAVRVLEQSTFGRQAVPLFRYAYGGGPEPRPDPESILRWLELESWMHSQLERRLHEVADDAAAAKRAKQWSTRENGQMLTRWRAVNAINEALIASGAIVLLVWLARRRVPTAPAVRSGLPPWSLATAAGVLVRGDFWARVYWLAAGEVQLWLSESQSVLALDGTGNLSDFAEVWFGSGALIGSLPLLWLVWTRMIAPHPGALTRVFGLRVGRTELAGLCALAAAAVAVDLVGSALFSEWAWRLGFDAHWSEGVDEILIWGGPLETAAVVADLVIWAPSLEELAFRGVLYLGLRRHLGVGAATLASAAIFGAIHFYSLPGFAATFWSGVVWALVFERSRSLWPGIAAHAIYNGLYVAGLVLIYR